MQFEQDPSSGLIVPEGTDLKPKKEEFGVLFKAYAVYGTNVINPSSVPIDPEESNNAS